MCVCVCVCERKNSYYWVWWWIHLPDLTDRRGGEGVRSWGKGAKKNRHFGPITTKAHDDDDNGGRDPSGIAQPSGLHPKWVWRQRKDADGNAPRRLGRKTWQILKKWKTVMTRITVSRGGYCYRVNCRIVPIICIYHHHAHDIIIIFYATVYAVVLVLAAAQIRPYNYNLLKRLYSSRPVKQWPGALYVGMFPP